MKYFSFWLSFSPQDTFKDLWTRISTKTMPAPVKMSSQDNKSIWISPVCPKRMVLLLLLFLLSEMENARIFGMAKCLRWWEEEKTLKVFWFLLKFSHVQRWFLVLAKFGVSGFSHNFYYLTKIFFFHFFPCCFLILCFVLFCDWVSLSCNSTKQFIWSFHWWLFIPPPQLLIFSPSLYLMNIFLAFFWPE